MNTMTALQCVCGHFSIPLRIAERYGMLKSYDDNCDKNVHNSGYQNASTLILPSCSRSSTKTSAPLQTQQAQCRLCKAEGRPYLGHTLPQCSYLTEEEIQDLQESVYEEEFFSENESYSETHSDNDCDDSENVYEDRYPSTRHPTIPGDHGYYEDELYYESGCYESHDSDCSEDSGDHIHSSSSISARRVTVDEKIYPEEDRFDNHEKDNPTLEIDFCMLCQQSFYTSAPVDIMDPSKCYCGYSETEPQEEVCQEEDRFDNHEKDNPTLEIDFCMLCQQSFYTSAPVNIMDPSKCYCGSETEPQEEVCEDEVTGDNCYGHGSIVKGGMHLPMRDQSISNREDNVQFNHSIDNKCYPAQGELNTIKNMSVQLIKCERGNNGDQNSDESDNDVDEMKKEDARSNVSHGGQDTAHTDIARMKCELINGNDGYHYKKRNEHQDKDISKYVLNKVDHGHIHVNKCEGEVMNQDQCDNVCCDYMSCTTYAPKNACKKGFDHESASDVICVNIDGCKVTSNLEKESWGDRDSFGHGAKSVIENGLVQERHYESQDCTDVLCMHESNSDCDVHGGSNNDHTQDMVHTDSRYNANCDELKDSDDNEIKGYTLCTIANGTNRLAGEDNAEYERPSASISIQPVESGTQVNDSVFLSSDLTTFPPGINTCTREQISNVFSILELLGEPANHSPVAIKPVNPSHINAPTLTASGISAKDIISEIPRKERHEEEDAALMSSHNNSSPKWTEQYAVLLPQYSQGDSTQGASYQAITLADGDDLYMLEPSAECSETEPVNISMEGHIMEFSSDCHATPHSHRSDEPLMFTAEETSCIVSASTKPLISVVIERMHLQDFPSHVCNTGISYRITKPVAQNVFTVLKVVCFSKISEHGNEDAVLFNHTTRPPECCVASLPAKAVIMCCLTGLVKSNPLNVDISLF